MTYEVRSPVLVSKFCSQPAVGVNIKKCITTLELTLFLEPGGQKSGCLALDGFHSAGNLELQLVEKIESLTSRKIKDEWFLQLLRSIFRKSRD